MSQSFHDAADPREHLEHPAESVVCHALDRCRELVQEQLHSELAGLVLHDEEYLVMRRRARLLRVQYRVELRVVAVAHVL